MEQCKKEYDEWVKLLKESKNEQMLQDPYAIWLEAWHVARITNSRETLHSD